MFLSFSTVFLLFCEPPREKHIFILLSSLVLCGGVWDPSAGRQYGGVFFVDGRRCFFLFSGIFSGLS